MSLSYEITNWENGKTVLKSEHLRKIEKGITDIISENDAIYKDEDTRKSNEKQRQEEHSRKMNEASEVVSNIQKDYDSLQKIIIDENASANLQNQINSVNSQLEQKANLDDNYISLNRFEKLETDLSDSERFQRAIAYSLENNVRTIKINGTINLHSPVKIEGNVNILGDNNINSKILYNTNIGDYAIEFLEPTNGKVFSGCKISDISFDCESQTAGRCALAFRHNNTRVIIENCNFTNCKNGVEMTGHSYGNTIRNCIFTRIQEKAIYSTGNAEQFTIDKCWIDYGDSSNSVGVEITNATSGQILNTVIQNYTTGIKAIGCKLIVMENLHFEACINESVFISPNALGYWSEGNVVKNVYVRGGKRAITFNASDSTYGGRVVKNLMLENITITSVTEGGIVCDNHEKLEGVLVVNCGFHKDFITDLPLVRGFTPSFEINYSSNKLEGDFSINGRLEANQINVKGLPAYKFANLGGMLGLTYNDQARFCVGSAGASIYGNGTKGAQINYSSTSDSKPGFTFNGYNSTGFSIGGSGDSLIMVIDGVKYLELLSNGNLRLKQGATITYDL